MPKHVKSASCVTTHNYLLSMSFTANFACSKDERQNQLEKVDSHLSNSKSGRRRSTFSPTINYCFTKSVDMSRSRTTQRFKNTKQFRNVSSSSFVYIIYIIFLNLFGALCVQRQKLYRGCFLRKNSQKASRLDILFLSIHNIHKSSSGNCFWA